MALSRTQKTWKWTIASWQTAFLDEQGLVFFHFRQGLLGNRVSSPPRLGSDALLSNFLNVPESLPCLKHLFKRGVWLVSCPTEVLRKLEP